METGLFLEIWRKHIRQYKKLKEEEYEIAPSGSVRMEITKANIMLELIADMIRYNARDD